MRPGFGARPNVGDPVLRAAPAFNKGWHLKNRSRLTRRREDQNIAFGVATDGTEIPRVRRIEEGKFCLVGGVEKQNRGQPITGRIC